MKSHIFLVLFLGVNAHADLTYITHDSSGKPIATFTQVQGPSGPGGSFGQAWKDPSGVIWSTFQGKFTNDAIRPDLNSVVVDSPATEACAKIGGELPSDTDYSKLASYFEMNEIGFRALTPQGRFDFYSIFPDMQLRWFWTSSVMADFPTAAWGFTATMASSVMTAPRSFVPAIIPSDAWPGESGGVLEDKNLQQ